LDWSHSAGDAWINSYYGTLYGTWFCKNGFIDATFISAYNHYNVSRHIHLPRLRRHAHNSHGGYQLEGSLGSGLLFTPGRFQVQPYARADYIFLHQSGFTEQGARSLDLKVKDKNSRLIRTDLGLKVARCYIFTKTKLIPSAKASWIWEKQLDKSHFEARLKDTHCNFRVTGLHPLRSLLALGIGLTTLAYDDTFAFSVYDDAEIGKKFWENRFYLNFGYHY
jgi:outer membrane autotransporter protein